MIPIKIALKIKFRAIFVIQFFIIFIKSILLSKKSSSSNVKFKKNLSLLFSTKIPSISI